MQNFAEMQEASIHTSFINDSVVSKNKSFSVESLSQSIDQESSHSFFSIESDFDEPDRNEGAPPNLNLKRHIIILNPVTKVKSEGRDNQILQTTQMAYENKK